MISILNERRLQRQLIALHAQSDAQAAIARPSDDPSLSADEQAAGFGRFIDPHEGDLRETLKRIDGLVDFMRMDIWIAMARPVLELVSPHLRPSAMIVIDDTEQHRQTYADYFAFLTDPANRFRTMTLPFDGGLELTVRT